MSTISIPGTATVSAASGGLPVLGPCFTGAGTRDWFLVLQEDCIIAVPQSVKTSLSLSIRTPENGFPLFGLLGGLLMPMFNRHYNDTHEKVSAQLRSNQGGILKAKTNVYFHVSHLKVISFGSPTKLIGFGQITIEKNTGMKETYKMQQRDFDDWCAQFKQVYPGLCRDDS